MKFIIRIPGSTEERHKLDGMLNALEDYFSLVMYSATIIVTDGDPSLEPMLAGLPGCEVVPDEGINVCEECGQLHNRNSPYCSDRCRKRAKRKREAEGIVVPPEPEIEEEWDEDGKQCPECGTVFEGRAKFCSQSCYNKDYYRRQKEGEAQQESQASERPTSNGGGAGLQVISVPSGREFLTQRRGAVKGTRLG